MKSFEPYLLGSVAPSKTELYRDHLCVVVDRGFAISLELTGEWRQGCASVMSNFNANRLVASQLDGWDGHSVEFLDEVPASLRSVRISTNHLLDWKPLERRTDLESIALNSQSGKQGEIDFTRFPRLLSCSIKWLPQWASIQRCSWLKSLTVSDSFDVHKLDLAEMADLEELVLESLGSLREVRLADRAKLRALKLSQCPKLQIDLGLFVKDVEFLWLGGRTAYPLDGLVRAINVKKLMLTFINNKVVPPPFVSQLKNLRHAFVLKTRLSEADMVLLRDVPK